MHTRALHSGAWNDQCTAARTERHVLGNPRVAADSARITRKTRDWGQRICISLLHASHIAVRRHSLHVIVAVSYTSLHAITIVPGAADLVRENTAPLAGDETRFSLRHRVQVLYVRAAVGICFCQAYRSRTLGELAIVHIVSQSITICGGRICITMACSLRLLPVALLVQNLHHPQVSVCCFLFARFLSFLARWDGMATPFSLARPFLPLASHLSKHSPDHSARRERERQQQLATRARDCTWLLCEALGAPARP